MIENSWPVSGPTHISTYPILGGILHPQDSQKESQEGGPGSGPSGGSGGKPNVIAHYTYSGPRYTAGLKIPKEEPRSASPHSTSQSPASDVKSKNDAELKRRQASMYQSETTAPKESECMSGGILSPPIKKEADSGSSFAQVLRPQK